LPPWQRAQMAVPITEAGTYGQAARHPESAHLTLISRPDSHCDSGVFYELYNLIWAAQQFNLLAVAF
jgi:hypothetical protein